MDDAMNRRDWLRTLTLSGAAAGLGMSMPQAVAAQNSGESNGFQSSVISPREIQLQRSNPSVENGRVLQPARVACVAHNGRAGGRRRAGRHLCSHCRSACRR